MKTCEKEVLGAGRMEMRLFWPHEVPRRHRSRFYKRHFRFEGTRIDARRFVAIEYYDYPPGTVRKDTGRLVAINRVEVVWDGTFLNSNASRDIERLLVRWLVRAYGKRYGTSVGGN